MSINNPRSLGGGGRLLYITQPRPIIVNCLIKCGLLFSPFDRYPGISDPRIPTANYINWPAFTTDGEKYLVIDVAEPRVERKLGEDRIVFWEDFLPSLA